MTSGTGGSAAWPDDRQNRGPATGGPGPMTGRTEDPAMDADDVIELLGLEPLSRWITGADLVVDGGILTRPTW